MEHWETTDEQLKDYAESMKKEKGLGSFVIAPEAQVVEALNLLLRHTVCRDLQDTIVGLKLVLERLGLAEKCYIAVSLENYLVSIEMYDDSDEW